MHARLGSERELKIRAKGRIQFMQIWGEAKPRVKEELSLSSTSCSPICYSLNGFSNCVFATTGKVLLGPPCIFFGIFHLYELNDWVVHVDGITVGCPCRECKWALYALLIPE